MTSVSGASSTPTSSNSKPTLAAAQSSLGKLLILNGMQANLDSDGTKKPTSQQVLATLWNVFDANGDGKITKTDIQTAVKNLGGTPSDASAVWSQISPYGLNNISQTSFDKNSFVRSTINTNMPNIQKAFSAYTSSAAGIAEKAMSALMTSNDVISALSSQSSTYVPPTTNQVLSTVWALFDVNSTKTISQADVKQAVLAEGGTVSGANAIWSQLSPHGAASVNASQFVSSPFMTSAMTANNQTMQSEVSQVQLNNAGTSNSVLDKFSSGGADILNGAATGFNNSPIGGGGYTNYLNLFV